MFKDYRIEVSQALEQISEEKVQSSCAFLSQSSLMTGPFILLGMADLIVWEIILVVTLQREV